MSYLMDAMRRVFNSPEFEDLVKRTPANSEDQYIQHIQKDFMHRVSPMGATLRKSVSEGVEEEVQEARSRIRYLGAARDHFARQNDALTEKLAANQHLYENLLGERDALKAQADRDATSMRLLREERDSYLATILSHQKYGAEVREKLADAEARLGRADQLLTNARCEGERLAENAWSHRVTELQKKVADAEARLGRADRLLTQHILDKQELLCQVDGARADVNHLKVAEAKTAAELNAARERINVVEEERDGARERADRRCSQVSRLEGENAALRKSLADHISVIDYWKERAEGPTSKKGEGCPPF